MLRVLPRSSGTRATRSPLSVPSPRRSHPAPRRAPSLRALADESEQDEEESLFDVLGINPADPPSVVKAAYVALQKRVHPDVAGALGHRAPGTGRAPWRALAPASCARTDTR